MLCSSGKCAFGVNLNGHDAAEPRRTAAPLASSRLACARGPEDGDASGSPTQARAGCRSTSLAALRGKPSLLSRRRTQSVRRPAATGAIVALLSMGSGGGMIATAAATAAAARFGSAVMACCGPCQRFAKAQQCCLTPRSTRDPQRHAAWAARPCRSIIGRTAQASCRGGRVSSNVRPHTNASAQRTA